MKASRNVFIMAGAVLIFLVGCALAQNEKKESADTPVTIASILKAAEVPLSEDQAKQVKEFNPSQGPDTFMKLYQIFDDKQKDALKKTLGVLPARENFPETPRSFFLIVILDNLNCPLTQKQVDQLKDIPMDQNGWKKMDSILSDAQKEAMKKSFGR